jgi:hypothetical protein
MCQREMCEVGDAIVYEFPDWDDRGFAERWSRVEGYKFWFCGWERLNERCECKITIWTDTNVFHGSVLT